MVRGGTGLKKHKWTVYAKCRTCMKWDWKRGWHSITRGLERAAANVIKAASEREARSFPGCGSFFLASRSDVEISGQVV